MLDRDGLRVWRTSLVASSAPKLTKKWVWKRVLPENAQNFGNFGQKRGKNVVNFIVGSIPSSRGYQLMP